MNDGHPIVLLTGASGFVGSHLTPVLESNGWIVRKTVRTPTGSDNEVLVDSIG